MKRKLFLMLVAVIAAFALVACGGNNEPETTTAAQQAETTTTETTTEAYVPEEVDEREGRNLTIATPRGPAALGMLHLIDSAELRNEYEFAFVGAPDEIPPMLVRGEVDIAAVPPNMAAILANNPNLDVQVVALTTLGVLHIVDATGTINSVEDLRGRTIYSAGSGGTPEFILNHVLIGNGLTPGVDVTVNFRSEHTEIAALIEGGLAEIAMLPEPFATATVNRIEGLEYALDMTAEWAAISPDAGLTMTAVVVRSEIIENHPDAISLFLEELEESIRFVQNDVDAAAELAVEHEIIPAVPVARLAIPRSNVTFIAGAQMQAYLHGVLEVFYAANPQAVGGQMPNEDFYFIR